MPKAVRREPPPETPAPIRPNMLLINGNAVSSTFAQTDLSHSVLTQVRFFNSRLHQSNFEGSAFDDCDLDGATFTGCSLRGVEFTNCDVDRLVINGINIGNLLRLLHGTQGGL
ncbi:pentapeptide repeat-containing protein [Streptomyces sp. F001]|uniref:pentapeptide repeat-containing protein n=1 Tax=Streptomyces sp. F001 TaxID=1510026 RepID=UPI00101E7109|nr:pentapeptide repeat-containing protein [Streptomyces sp. F001]RZB13784.1 pentapeptide repeat-containing protein [Streptomyces sp. F001]